MPRRLQKSLQKIPKTVAQKKEAFRHANKNRLAKVQSKKLADSGLTKINGWKHLSHVYYQPNSIPVSRNSVIITPERQFSQILHRLHIRCSPTVHLQCHATFCCNNNRNPSLRILTAAFTSRSCSSPQHGHFQCLILKSFTASFRYPQSEHI